MSVVRCGWLSGALVVMLFSLIAVSYAVPCCNSFQFGEAFQQI
jgi:hypothetical protein